MLDLWNLRLRPGTPSGDTVEARMDFYSVPEALTGCVLWHGGVDKDGYGTLRVGGKTRKAHVIAWERKHRRRVPKGRIVCHRCDLPPCVNEDHVRLGTHKTNGMEKSQRGRARSASGETHPFSKLTDADVARIRLMTCSHQMIADKYGVARSLISRIKSRHKWKHVP